MNINKVLSEFKEGIINSKKYWIIYMGLILISTLTIFDINNYSNPKIEVVILLLISLFGIFSISYYFSNSNEKELYKIAFIVILLFGIVCSVLMPIACAPDEYEHFVRSEITSTGVLFPHYQNGSYSTIYGVFDLIGTITQYRGENYNLIGVDNATVFTTDADTLKINYTIINYHSAFAQNPFYGYLAQGLGIDIAKLLDLNVIWMLWLGRIFNLILYACLVAFAVKKTPILKIPLIVIACMPLAIYQASSLSIDSFINGVGILLIAYFFNMYKSPKGSLNIRDIAIFSIICLLLGLTKITFFLFVFLLLFIPKDNFKGNAYYYSFMFVGILGLIGYLWTSNYAGVAFHQSYRHEFWVNEGINSTNQLNYLLSHKKDAVIEIFRIPQYLETDLLFNSRDLYFNSFNSLFLMFLGAVTLMYPTPKFDLKVKFGSLIVVMGIYIVTYLTFLLTWTPVSQLNPIVGVQPRYFLPLFALLPVIVGINHNENDSTELDSYVITLTITFLAIMIISMLGFYY